MRKRDSLPVTARPSPILLVLCLFLVALWLAVAFVSHRVARRSDSSKVGWHPLPPTPIRRQFERDLGSLAREVTRLHDALARRDSAEAHHWYRASRIAYKRVEGLLAYYSPTTASALDGPIEADDRDAPPVALGRRSEFQIVQAALTDAPAHSPNLSAATEAALRMLGAIRRFRSATALLDIADTSMLDAARLELARVSTLGISGFDADPPDETIVESADAVDGMRQSLELLQNTRGDTASAAAKRDLESTLARASANLRSDTRFDEFDRTRFIAEFAQPAARAIRAMRESSSAAPAMSRRAWRPSAASPFDSNAFDASAFAPGDSPSASEAWVAFGERLFSDPRLSGTGTRSCASCHVPSLGFTDRRTRAAALSSGDRSVLRRTPTLWNAALQPTLFADQRASALELQVGMVLSSTSEMNSSAQSAAARVRGDSFYRAAYDRIAPGHGVDERGIRIALASYLRSLTALNARFDRAVRGDSAALTAAERHGFNLFTGKARCATCHFPPLFNGVMPPDFTRSELEIIGVPRAPAAAHAVIDPDAGRARIDGFAAHEHAFKVPSLRNVAIGGPYMHNGVYPTLEAVVDFYNRGGGVGIGERLPEQTLSARRLDLSVGEQRDLVAFLRALVDTSELHRRVAIP